MTVMLLISALSGEQARSDSGSSDPRADLQSAQLAFDQGEYDHAITTYELYAKKGNGHVLYNLGIAYYRKNRLGDAMSAFLAARRLLPRDPDVQANLHFLTGTIKDKLEPEIHAGVLRSVAFWTKRTTPRELAWAFGISGVFVALALLLTSFVPRLKAERLWAYIGLVIPAALGAALAVSSAEDDRWGAVAKAQAAIYSGPDQATRVFDLQEGAPFRVAEKSALGFWRIELSDGKKGWIADSDVRVF